MEKAVPMDRRKNGNIFYEWRVKKHLNQTEAGNIIGCSPQRVSRLERGGVPTPKELSAVYGYENGGGI